MSNDRTVENVRLLYQSGSYKEALESCLAYLEDKEALTDESRKSEVKEVFLISALSLMNMSLVPPTSENRDIICTSIINACNYANSIEEAHQIENEVFSEFYLWKEKSIRAQLEKVENNPSFDNWKAYYPLIPEYSEFAIFLSLANFNNNVVNQYCESEGINKANYRDGYPLPQDQFTSDDRETLEYATGLRIYNRAKIELEESGNLSTVPAQALSRKVIEHLILAELMISHSKGKNLPPEVLNDRLKAEAEIINYKLSAYIHANGQKILLYQSDRQSEISKLERIYSKIKETEPDFAEPPLPNAATSASTGGCYVATSVYGSYNCPQVWTLRRYRDYTLAKTWHGRAFIRTYYTISPTIVKLFGNMEWFKGFFKSRLDKMVNRLNKEGVSDMPYTDRNW